MLQIEDVYIYHKGINDHYKLGPNYIATGRKASIFMAHYWVSDSGSINATVVKKMSPVLGSRFNFHYILLYTSPEQ